jgi:response regulator RpfG family c-di-GMP phosphodiesterase
MGEKILCVDDDKNILSAYQRQLRKRFEIDTALGGEPALEALAQQGPYAVVISDMRMPGMDGIQLLSKVKAIAPDSVRMMLTGNGDLKTAMDAVNEGNIFRFLTKPCSPDALALALDAGLEQHRLITAERELLEKTLRGSVRMLIDVLSIADPQSFGIAELLRDAVKVVARHMGLAESWELEMAAMLCQIGLVAVPPAVIAKARTGGVLSEREKEMISRVPEIGRRLLHNIPRMESLARTVEYQNKHYDGSGWPEDSVAGDDIPMNSRILKVVLDLLEIEAMSMPRLKAFHFMKKRRGWYDPKVLDVAIACLLPLAPPVKSENEPVVWKESSPQMHTSSSLPGGAPPGTTKVATVRDLEVGHILLSDLKDMDGRLLLVTGHRFSEASLARIRSMAETGGVKEPIFVC